MPRQHNAGGAFHAKHALGQNFILDDGLLSELADLSGVTREDTVLEIGPGMGTLTRALSERAQRVLCVEYDETLRPYLEARLSGCKNVEILFADALGIRFDKEIRERFGEAAPLRVCANLPYYITSELITKLTQELPDARSMALMVQREVADKMRSVPGEDGYGPLALRLQRRYAVRIAKEVPRDCFEPKPRVDSAFVVLDRLDAPAVPVKDEAKLERLIRMAFAMRRKTLMNNLGAMGIPREESRRILQKMGLPESVRAEEMSLAEFCALADRIG